MGIIANQPKVLAGCLDIDAVSKPPALFELVMHSTFRLSLVDVPGFCPELCKNEVELRHGAATLCLC